MSCGLGPLWQRRWPAFHQEWGLFTAHRGGRPWIGKRVETGER
jgi:hypothetical protein